MPKINLQYGDAKYYYKLHCLRQQARGRTPVTYQNFTRRLKKMNLHDAIYTPRVEYNVRKKDLSNKQLMANYNMKPKKTLLQRFNLLLKKLGLKKEC